MRHCTTILILLLATTAFGQTRDRRAVLDIRGAVNEISVSPDEKIWLVTAMGNTYYTNHIDSNWHDGKPIFESTSKSGIGDPHLERISFFNKDTAILTGYISGNQKGNKSGYYLTKDAGKTWNLLDYGGDSWIYSIHTDNNGNAWMGGLGKELYYSSDFGQHWTTIQLPYKSSDRTYGIYMSSATNGIASSDDNEIITTRDNWKTVTYLKTPLDQKKYQPDESRGYVDDRISKILEWNHFLVVNQNGYIFYSAATNIQWKPFPIAIVDFAIDIDSKKLFAVTDSLAMIAFSTPTEFQTLTDNRLTAFPIDMKVVNQALYVVTKKYEVYRANKNRLTGTTPYTTDKKIAAPRIVKRFSKLTWGCNGNQIYLSADTLQDWFRENTLAFRVADCKLLNDSVAILWDGIQNNYLYSLKDHTPSIYYPADPIDNFLSSPVKSYSINAGSSGCYHMIGNEVNYERRDDTTFKTSELSVQRYQDEQPSAFHRTISNQFLSTALAAINSNPSRMPAIQDFQITEKDKKNYLDLVDQQLESKETDYFNRKRKINKAFYYSVPAMLDTLNSSVIASILHEREGWSSTTSNWFNVRLINQNNDTLNFSRNYFVSTLPRILPWEFEYKGAHFNCYNVDFSRFIHACLPDNFISKEIFDNKLLLMKIADYLYNKE